MPDEGADMPRDEDLDLQISRVLRAPRAALWRAWTEPDLLQRWWCPKPWTTQVVEFDPCPGGAFHTLLRGPDGSTSDNPGCFLEMVPTERIAFTTALVRGWRPAPAPWLSVTARFTLADEPGGGTRYLATCMHPDRASRDRHEQMGFYEGWSVCIDQLDAVALSLLQP
jgi:uncharacterized protein YndB with AHSA1/START domain